jgi:hypothetical protein
VQMLQLIQNLTHDTGKLTSTPGPGTASLSTPLGQPPVSKELGEHKKRCERPMDSGPPRKKRADCQWCSRVPHIWTDNFSEFSEPDPRVHDRDYWCNGNSPLLLAASD